jgi:hypothetical protein
MEAINAQLTHGWPSLGLMLDEAGQFVSGYMGKKFYHLNKLADGEPISVDRRGAPPLQSKTGRVSLILAMQGGPFDALTSSPHALDSGFFQRAWAVVIERTRGDAIGLLGSAYEWYCKLVNYCLLAEVQLVRAGLPRTTLTFSPEAAARWHKEERGVRLTAEFNAIKEHCPAVLHRFGENVSRTAGMLHAVDQYRNNHGRTEISLETLCTAIAMEKQNLKSVGTILIEGLAEQARERSEILRNWLYEKVYLRCSDECDRVELLRYGSECLRKQSDRDQALRGLIRDGWVVEGTRPPGNAKTVILVKERFSELYRARNPQQAPIIGTWKVLGKRR